MKRPVHGFWHGAAFSLLAFLLVCQAPAQAASPKQPAANDLPVRFYTPADFIQAMYRHSYPPQAAEFADKSRALVSGMNDFCGAPEGKQASALQGARSNWRATALAWDQLSAVAIGPLVKRRSQRQIDFTPTRPELIKRAILKEPADALAMERIGTPAKGLPALEWLLWTRPSPETLPGSAACRYAQQLALDIQTEATALRVDFDALAAPGAFADRNAATLAMNEWVNQWIGGLERLRWAQMEKPLHSARSEQGSGQRDGQGNASPASAPDFPRQASASTAQSWAAEWRGIATITLNSANKTEGVTLETYLRGRGLQPLANKLASLSMQVQHALPKTAPGAGAAGKTELLATTRALATLKRFAEAEVAPALDVNIGFSDADGD